MSEPTGGATPRRKLSYVLLWTLPVLILASSLAAWYVSLPRPQRATALLKISREVPSILGDGRADDEEYQTYLRTQKAILRSRLILMPVLDGSAISNLETVRRRPAPIDWLEQNLEIRQLDGSEIVEISLAADTYWDASRIVNAVADVYMAEIVDVEREQRKSRLDELKRIEEECQKRASQARNGLVRLREQLKPKDGEGIHAHSIDLTAIEHEVEAYEGLAREISGKIVRGQVDLMAPPRIQLLRHADPMKSDPVAVR